MDTYYTVVFFILGLVLGSFYNVVGLRICKHENLLFPSSHCPKCNHKLKVYELVPVISYIFLRGKCSSCKTRISIMYPIVELLTGILFGLMYYMYHFTPELFLGLIVSSLLMIVLVTDLNYYIIPDSIIISFAILVFVYNLVTKGILESFIYIGYGILIFILMYALMKLGNMLFKEESLGGGDIKLMSALGMIAKPLVSVLSLSLAAFIALPCSLYFLIKKKDKIIPFGPFLVIGVLIIMILGIDTNDIVSFLTNK